jgi:hypothetical protein
VAGLEERLLDGDGHAVQRPLALFLALRVSGGVKAVVDSPRSVQCVLEADIRDGVEVSRDVAAHGKGTGGGAGGVERQL